ncbi:MAG: AsmA-like C-terminal region-containing protein, partial [Gallionella sp.]
AIGFTHHPEDALNVAIQFRKTVTANQHNDYPDIQVRVGIHLGPINIFQDMNGRNNMVGDGINDAQRVMSFAGIDQIYISRSYFDFISRLSIEYANLFSYMGSLKDKHGREHPVYKLVDMVAHGAANETPLGNSAALDVKLEPFTIPGAAAPSATPVEHSMLNMGKDDDALLNDIGKFTQPEVPVSEHAPSTTPSSKKVKSQMEEVKLSIDEIKKLEHTQAKVWAEAEQRAKKVAKAKALWDVGQPLPATKVSTPLMRVKRKPFPWIKLVVGLVFVLLIVLLAAPFVVPTRDYVPRIERLLSSIMQQPVYIGRLEGRLLPTPRLDLIDMSIGEAKQIKSRLTRVNFAIPTLFTEVKSIDSVELQGVQINGIALQQISAWLQKAAADVKYPISRILLSEGKLEAEGFELSGVGGVLNFNQVGKFTAKLYAEGSKFTLDINSALGRKTGVFVSVRGSALPLLPSWIFDDLTAKGELTDKELVITELDSHILGGTLSGNARLGWGSGWQAQGLLVVETINIQNMLKSLSGDMSGTARFQMQSTSLAKLADAATLEGSFVIKKGVVNGIDMVETTRLRSTENMPGGRTHFDELRGNLSYARGTYTYRQLKMTGGVLTAKGRLNYAEQQVAGSIIADLTMREEMAPVALELGGTRDNPTLRVVR